MSSHWVFVRSSGSPRASLQSLESLRNFDAAIMGDVELGLAWRVSSGLLGLKDEILT